MILNEVAEILAKIEALYPNFHPADKKRTLAIWTDVLYQESAEDINKALKIYSREPHEFAPTAGQLIGIVRKYKPQELTISGAVNSLKEALKNATYGAEDEFKRLPRAVQLAVGSPAEIRRLSREGFNNYAEMTFVKRFEEIQDVMLVRKNELAIRGGEQVKRIGSTAK